MPRRDLTEDRQRMQELGKMDWLANASDLVKENTSHGPISYCPISDVFKTFTNYNGYIPHYISNPTAQRKRVGTRRVGGRKMPTRGVCSGCSANVILVDNSINPDWPLYIEKYVIREWL